MKDGKFTIDGVDYQLSRNDFGTDHRHHVHGGYTSFDRVNWNTSLTVEGDGVVFSILSPHGSEVGLVCSMADCHKMDICRVIQAT